MIPEIKPPTFDLLSFGVSKQAPTADEGLDFFDTLIKSTTTPEIKSEIVPQPPELFLFDNQKVEEKKAEGGWGLDEDDQIDISSGKAESASDAVEEAPAEAKGWGDDISLGEEVIEDT